VPEDRPETVEPGNREVAMREISLLIPTFESEQNIDIEVKINGKKRALHYRVEIVAWQDYAQETTNKVEVIRRVIRDRDKDWQLVQIGIPTDATIPIMFRKKPGEPA
jgi:hypothetical protein